MAWAGGVFRNVSVGADEWLRCAVNTNAGEAIHTCAAAGSGAEVKRRWSMPSKRRIQGNIAMNASASWAFKHYLRRMTKSIVSTIRVKIERGGNSMRGGCVSVRMGTVTEIGEAVGSRTHIYKLAE